MRVLQTTPAVATCALSAVPCMPGRGHAQDAGKPLIEVGIGGGAVRSELFPGATNDDSALCKCSVNLPLGAGLTSFFCRSDRRISAVSDISD